MKNLNPSLALIIMFSLFLLFSCDDDTVDDTPDTIGEVTVALDANKSHIRAEESLLGNLVADAYKEYAEVQGKTVDFAMVNSGSLRFSEDTRPNGIYEAGSYTHEIIEEIFPWTDEEHTVVSVTGSELKSILERSVSSLPNEYKGWFMQISKELKIAVNLNLQAQILNETVTPPVIETEGKRIVSIKINGQEYAPDSTYTLLTTTWISMGEDGYVTFANIPLSQKENLDCNGCEMNEEAIKLYIKTHTPVTPKIEGRITFVN